MKIYKEKKIPAKAVIECIGRKCDLCGKMGLDGWNGGSLHVENETEINITIKQREGWSCSDGGSGTEYEIDMCPKCFKDRLIPWLKSEGAQIDEKKWEW